MLSDELWPGRMPHAFGLLLAICVSVHVAAETQGPTYGLVKAWGRYGSGKGQFKHPVSIALDSQDRVYVVDQGNSRVQVFTSDGGFVTKWGEPDRARGGYGGTGNAAGKFRVPHGIAVDASGNVFVAEWGNHRVQKFAGDGTFLTKWGGRGAEDGLLSFPVGVAVDEDGNVYVADTGSARVQKYSGTGQFLMKIVKYGCRPHDVAVGASGDIHIAEVRGRFWRIAPDGSVIGWAGLGSRVESPDIKRTGWFGAEQTYSLKTGVGFWAEGGEQLGQFGEPRGIGVDRQGNAYVADSRNQRIQKFTREGKLVTAWGTKGKGPGQFNWPYDVAIDRRDNVYVVDKYNNRVQKFAPSD